MATDTKIAWATSTFNPWIGCTKVSPGCTNCYAETFTTNRMGRNVWGRNAPRQRTGPDNWRKPHSWNRRAAGRSEPYRVFCGSFCDWAEDFAGPVIDAKRNELPVTLDNVRDELWQLIRETPNLHWMLLTKRPERIAGLLPPDWGEHGYHNVWLGTSIESNDYVGRAEILRTIPAVVRFVSYEPALGPLDQLDLAGIDWVIYGGESGSGFRPEDKQWARDMRDRCRRAGVAFFHKQSAAYRTEMGIELDGEIIREFPVPRVLPQAAVAAPGVPDVATACRSI